MATVELTVREAGELLGIGKACVHKYLAQGRISGRQTTGGMWLLKQREVERFARIPRRPGVRLKKSAKPR